MTGRPRCRFRVTGRTVGPGSHWGPWLRYGIRLPPNLGRGQHVIPNRIGRGREKCRHDPGSEDRVRELTLVDWADVAGVLVADWGPAAVKVWGEAGVAGSTRDRVAEALVALVVETAVQASELPLHGEPWLTLGPDPLPAPTDPPASRVTCALSRTDCVPAPSPRSRSGSRPTVGIRQPGSWRGGTTALSRSAAWTTEPVASCAWLGTTLPPTRTAPTGSTTGPWGCRVGPRCRCGPLWLQS